MRSFVAIAVLVAVIEAECAAGSPHAPSSPRALDDASCFSCQVLFNDTARVLTDGAAAATRKALQMGLRIPEGGRLLNPEFTTTLDSDINCPHPPEACMTFSTEIALVWTNAFMFVNSGAASEASVWASTLMQDTSRWMTNGTWLVAVVGALVPAHTSAVWNVTHPLAPSHPQLQLPTPSSIRRLRCWLRLWHRVWWQVHPVVGHRVRGRRQRRPGPTVGAWVAGRATALRFVARGA